jgi:hypothetical protein
MAFFYAGLGEALLFMRLFYQVGLIGFMVDSAIYFKIGI